MVNEHLYSANQATRQTENRLYTQGKEVMISVVVFKTKEMAGVFH